MTGDGPIRIAVAVIVDPDGRLLLVRKSGTRSFMQAGGKIEPGESAPDALRRELSEELGIVAAERDLRHLGRRSAPAANEPGRHIEAELFHFRVSQPVVAAAEIAELRWVMPADAPAVPLAPLTRDHVLPLAAAILAGHPVPIAEADRPIY